MKLLAINKRPAQPRLILGALLATLVCLTAWPARGAMTLNEAVDIAQRWKTLWLTYRFFRYSTDVFTPD
jgi:hypothetical protein